MSLVNLSKTAATLANGVKTAASLINKAIQSAFSFLLKEDGGYLLLETGDKIILEDSGSVTNLSKTAA